VGYVRRQDRILLLLGAGFEDNGAGRPAPKIRKEELDKPGTHNSYSIIVPLAKMCPVFIATTNHTSEVSKYGLGAVFLHGRYAESRCNRCDESFPRNQGDKHTCKAKHGVLRKKSYVCAVRSGVRPTTMHTYPHLRFTHARTGTRYASGPKVPRVSKGTPPASLQTFLLT
jgi:hypothetical protein